MNPWNESLETANVPGTCFRSMAENAQGHTQQLSSGSLRVKVYAGTDPATGKERRLREACPTTPPLLSCSAAC
jgi:hypothetical protein